MTAKTMIIYDLENKTPAEKTNIHRKLFGFSDKSNNGKYTYPRKGLLSDIPHEKAYKTALIISTKHAEYVTKTLEKFDVNIVKIKPA